jgi:hypothetical protein
MDALLFLFVILIVVLGAAILLLPSQDLSSWEEKGKRMAKVPTPPEHLNPPGSSYGPIPVEWLKGDHDDEDTYWELCYLTRNDSEAQFRHETRAYMYLDSAKDDAIVYKKSPTFYRAIRICQRLKSAEFRDF